MAIKDIANQLLPKLIFEAEINNSGQLFSPEFDTADFDAGLMITAFKVAETGASGHSIRLQESDTSGGPFTTISDLNKIVAHDDNAIILTLPADTSGDTLQKMGLISNKRYIRVSVDSSVTNGDSQICVILMASNENLPESDNPDNPP